MTVIGLQTSIWSNRLKIGYLILLFPIIVFLGIWLSNYLMMSNYEDVFNSSLNKSFYIFIISLPFILIWLFLGISFQKSIIFKFSGARELTRKESPKIYNIVENLAISRGIKSPRIGIINDSSLNAFATGWSKNNSWIVFSKGLLEKLDKDEVEAVAAHELTHILNEDVKMMVIVTVFIGIIGTIGEILIRSGRYTNKAIGNKKGQNPLPIIGIVLYIIGLMILPLINLAISRRREFLADAGSVELTGNKDSMIKALKKISFDTRIESIQKNGIAAMCIANPFVKKGLSNRIKSFFSTHPSIEDRVYALKQF